MLIHFITKLTTVENVDVNRNRPTSFPRNCFGDNSAMYSATTAKVMLRGTENTDMIRVRSNKQNYLIVQE